MLPSQYIARTYQEPSGFQCMSIPNNCYTDDQIDNLYLQFASCYASRMYKMAKSYIKGTIGKADPETAYLLTALYVLRNWYNPNPALYTFFNLFNILGTGTNSVNLYLVTAEGSDDTSQLLDTASGYTTLNGAYTDLMTNAPNYLLGQQGWGLQLNNLLVLIPPAHYTGRNWLWVHEANNGTVYTTLDQWIQIQSYSPALTISAVQNIIANCKEICNGCGCTPNDDIFVPLGQTFIRPSDILTKLPPNPYFL